MVKGNRMHNAIIVITYDRPASLMRLLDSVLEARYPSSDVIDLIVSIDKSTVEAELVKVAKSLKWPFGELIVRTFPQRQGLREHVLQCGDYAYQYDAVVLLEDDLIVSPYFYSYTKQALAKYSNDENISGISLYKHLFHPGAYRPFEAENNGYDAYLMQFAQSWGQCWNQRMWNGFRTWYAENADSDLGRDSMLPKYITEWNEHSWLKYFMRYVVESNTFFIYPMISLSSNCSEAGQHNLQQNNDFEVPLLRGSMVFNLPNISNAVKYDVYFERMEVGDIIFQSYEGSKAIDLYGLRTTYSDASYVVSTNSLPYKQLLEVAICKRPIEENIIHPVAGNGIYLYDLSIPGKNRKARINLLTRYDVRGENFRNLFSLWYFELMNVTVSKLASLLKTFYHK